jgi:hypothetical protein
MSMLMNRRTQRKFQRSAYTIAFALILAIGAWSRFWELGSVPPGLNQDEASIGVEAYSLLHYGVDRNAVSFPVNFVSWGSGMDALYIYLVMPFVGLGLTPFVERLPMAISGVLTLPLVYLIGKRCIGERFGLLAMFFVAISPWHIMLSHWGLNDNILAFTFTLGVALTVLSTRANRWFIPAMAMFALSLYAYGAAYVAVPIFVLFASYYLLRQHQVSWGTLAVGWLVFLILSLPIALFLLVNLFGWETIRIGWMTIPRLPIKPRFENTGVVFSSDLWASLVSNLAYLWNTLWTQKDDFIWNALARYGYGYPGAILVAAVGLGIYVLEFRKEKNGYFWMLPIWLLAGLAIGLAQEANINRINLLLIPILVLMAPVVEFLFRKIRVLAWLTILGYLGLTLLFVGVYFGGRYNEMADDLFLDGLVPALQSASRYADSPICVTDHVVMPYIYAQWAEPADPRTYLPTIVYAEPNTQFRTVAKMGRYEFGIQNCSKAAGSIYVMKDELPPSGQEEFRMETYHLFRVYIPIRAGSPPPAS